MAVVKRDRGSTIQRILETTEFITQHDGLFEAEEAAKQLGYPINSALKLFDDMKEAGFLQESILGRLTLAQEFRDLSEAALSHDAYKSKRLDELNRLSELLGETCGISLASGVHMIYFERAESNWPIQIYLPPGAKIPMTASASGKLYLSTLPDAAQKTYLYNIGIHQYTRNTQMDTLALIDELKAIKAQGYATDKEEFIEGMCSIAVPIEDELSGFGYLFCHAPSFRTPPEKLLSYLPELKTAAQRIMKIMRPKA